MRYRCRTMPAALAASIAVVALTAGTALASGKPAAETKPATSIGETTATLHGSVNPNGVTTKYHFEYGTTTSYGKSTAEVNVGSGSSYLEESSAITALSANTAYHFRIVATSSNGTTDGADEKFSTLEKPGLPEFVLAKGETFPVKLTTTHEGGSVRLANFGGERLECSQTSFKSEITSGKKIAGSEEMHSCKATVEIECNTVGAPRGVVILSGIGSVVYIEKATKKVGIVLALTPAEIECGESEWAKLRGSLLAPITPINTKTTSYAMSYNPGKEVGTEEITKYENEKGELVTAMPEMSFGGSKYTSMEVDVALALTASKAITISA